MLLLRTAAVCPDSSAGVGTGMADAAAAQCLRSSSSSTVRLPWLANCIAYSNTIIFYVSDGVPHWNAHYIVQRHSKKVCQYMMLMADGWW